MSRSMEFVYIGDGLSEPGWRATCQPAFDPQSDAHGIVHDFIDHGPAPNYATVEGELAAFGTMAYSRLQYGSDGLTEKSLADEIAGFVVGYWYGPNDCRIVDGPGFDLLDPEDEALLWRISKATMKALLNDLRDMGWDGTPALSELVKCRRRIQAWLREGWQTAINRFPTISAPALAEAFEDLRDIVREKIKGVDEDGAILKLRVNEDAEPCAELELAEDRWESEEDEDESNYH